MENITKELNKKFDFKYDFLRLMSIVYDKSALSCKIIFLYPETVGEIDENSRIEIEDHLKQYLNLNASLTITYKKSFLKQDIIEKVVFDFVQKNYVSLISSLKKDDISVEIQENVVFVKLSLFAELLDYFSENNVNLKLKEHLEHLFYSVFNISAVEKDSLPENIIESRTNLLDTQIKLKKTYRYEVFQPEILLGKEIAPKPEIIAEQKGEKSSVILAGAISNIVKKPYKSKRSKNPEIDDHFYTFEIDDTTGKIPAIYFASASKEVKLDKLSEELHYLFLGDIRPNIFGKLTYYVKNISICKFDPSLINPEKEETEKVIEITDEYKTVIPQNYESSFQESLFGQVESYNEFIMNNDFVVFDVETTGLEPDVCEIIEIGAIKIEKGVLTKTFQSLIKPKNEIPTLITNITGIDNEMVASSPKVSDVLADFILFSKGCILSGYNVNFDIRFIQSAAKEIGFKFENRVEDAMAFARAQLSLGNYTLKNVAKNLDVSLKEAHRALNDAIATAKVLLKLNKKP